MNGFGYKDELGAGMSAINGYNNAYASSSSTPPYADYPSQYANAVPLREVPQHVPSMTPHQSQWNSMLSQGSHSQQHPPHNNPQMHRHHQQQQQQQFSNSHWQNQSQLQNSSYTNGMAGMNMGMGNYMSFLPQQVLHDAMTLSQPVQPADEPLLIQALLKAHKTRETYKDALNGLHGKSGHSSSLWKDYYLDHKHRIDDYVRSYLKPGPINTNFNPSPYVTAPKTVKKPTPDQFKVESPIVAPLPQAAASKRRARPHAANSTSPPPSTGTGRRSTINSLTAPAPVFDRNLPAPNADIKIPAPPSRSPTPPTKVVPHRGRGNKFTPEDKEFFLKFILWRLKNEPHLSRNELCDMLAAKAPHHSTQSWGSYWSNNHDLPDKIMVAYQGVYPEDLEESSSDEERIVIRKRPRYKEPSSSSGDDDDDAEGDDDEDEDEDADDDISIPPFDESAMGQKGGPFTEADFAILARHVASVANFKDAPSHERWDSFTDKYPQRSPKSWVEFYRRSQRRIDQMARKIRKQQNASTDES